MQKSTLLLLAFVSVVTFSCKKNKGGDDDGPSTNNEPTDTTAISKNFLSKVVSTSGSDVTTNSYRYDETGKLAWFSNTSTKADYFEDTSKIVRDASGFIKQIVYRSDSSSKYNDPKLDSVVFNVFHDAATSHYTYKKLQYKSYGVTFKDSSAYSYDDQNRITKEEAYYFDYKITKRYIKWAQYDFIYSSNGDITSRKTVYYSIDDDKTDYPFDITYVYHEKGINLLNLGNDGIVLGIQQNISAHIATKVVGNYPLSPQYNRDYTYTYKFNTKYRPLSATVSEKVTGSTTTIAYSYE